MLSKTIVVVLVCTAVVFSGCTPTRVVEIDVQIGTLVDREVGFFAYTTPLSENDPTKLLVTYSSEAAIEGREEIKSPESEFVYPMLAYSPSRTYVRPSYLSRKIRLNTAEPLEPETIHTLGYFKKTLSNSEFAESELDQITESDVDGLKWAILEQKNVERVRSEISGFARFAAKYGADAVIDVAVYFVGECSSCKDAGLIVEGTAIAFIE